MPSLVRVRQCLQGEAAPTLREKPDAPMNDLRLSCVLLHCPQFGNRGSFGCHSFEQVISNAKCVGHDRECRVHSSAGGKETRVDYVQVVEFVGFAVPIERGASRIVAKAHCSVLVGNAGQGNSLPDELIQCKHMVVYIDLANQALELRDKSLVSF